MPRDVELDRLKNAQDRAFIAKQDAWQAQDQAWQRRQAANERLDRAYNAKQAAYDEQDSAWNAYQQIRAYNRPRIDSLNSEQESAFESMKDAFERASEAHEARDGESARSYADDGHAYKAQAQEATAERRQLVQEIRDAKARHEATKPAFQQAKSEFETARDDHRRAKAEHEREQARFKDAKREFESAKDVFAARLAIVRSERSERHDDKRSLAEKAGVPPQYVNDVYISKDADGNINIYFGGVGTPDGPGHGHYALDRYGDVTYSRDPDKNHGAHNFADYEERGVLYDRGVSSERPRGARGEYSFRNESGHSTQYYEDGTRVSWDLDENGVRKDKHWTDQNVRKGRTGRHDPPPHAK